VNGHGGNISGLAALAVELTRTLRAPIATTTYFAEAEDEIQQVLEDQDGVMHACEAETSMMLFLAPELVDAARMGEAFGPAFDLAGSLTPSLRRVRTFDALTANGVSGDARRATVAKGEAILAASARNLAARLRAGEPWGPPADAECAA
jgi:creatinine amidohydrolase